MKKVLTTVILLCFLLTSLGIVSIATEAVEYDTYTLSGTISGAKEGDIISVVILNEGYTMTDLAASTGSVTDKVCFTNMYEAGASGKYSFDIIVPKGTSRDVTCVLTCNGIKKEDTLLSFLVSSGYLTVYYAAPNGKSSNNGTKESPYTWEKAKSEALTAAKTKDVEIRLLGGKYRVENTRIQFSDSGTNAGTGHRITFAAASKDDKPVFTSMKEVNHQYITKLTEGDVYNRIPEKSRGMIYKLDMKAAGFADEVPITNSAGEQTGTYTVLSMNYKGAADESKTIDPPIIYLNGKRQTLSRYPNNGSVAFDGVSGVVDNSDTNPKLVFYKFVDNRFSQDTINDFTDRMNFEKWDEQHLINDAFLAGYLHDSYRAAVTKITSVDSDVTKAALSTTTRKFITVDGTHPLYYPSTSGTYYGPRVVVVNLPEEMDVPGEYYFNQQDKCIYYYAPYELTADDVFEMANDRRGSNGRWGYPNLVHISNAENITFDGIEFYGSRYDNAIYVTESNGIEFKNCTIHATAQTGMVLAGKNILVENCNIYDTGQSAVSISGDVMITKDISVPSNNIVRNNHVYNYAQNPTYGYAINGIVLKASESVTETVDGVSVYRPRKNFGSRIENNLIHASKFAGGIRYAGLDITVKRNEIYNLLESTDDIGVVYTGRSVVEFGNTLTENYIHDFYNIENPRYNSMAIYWDDYQSGQLGTRNIVVGPENNTRYNDLIGVRTIGYDNEIRGNTFVNIYTAIGLTGRSPSSWTSQNAEYGFTNSLEKYLPVPEYEHYDRMVAMREALAARTDGKFIHMARAINNLTVNTTYGTRESSTTDGRIYEYGEDNVYGNETADDSIFVDPANHDYRVKASAITDGALSEVPNELNFDMDWIGIQTESPDADQSFKLMHPTNNESITKDSVILTWEQALFADKYEYVIATDSAFTNVVESGETKETFAIPTTTFTEGTTYYWKVKAVNFSRDMGGEWMCDKAQTFTVGNAVDIDVVENTILAADETTILGTFKGVSEFYLNYTVKNSGASSQEFIVIAAIYSDEDKFRYAKVSESATVDAGNTKPGTLRFTPAFTMEDGYYVKVFVVDKPNSIKPLSFVDAILQKQ